MRMTNEPENNILTNKSAESRFYSKIVTHDDPDACWDWKAYKDKDECGIFTMEKGNFRAPRLMWILANQSHIPDGYYVCHTCDNEACTNPKHLWVGTQLDNMRDRKEKGRYGTMAKGSNHYKAVLTEMMVRRICRMAEVGYGSSQIAGVLNLKTPCVRAVVNGSTWRHISQEYALPPVCTRKETRAKHQDILIQLANGTTAQELAYKYRCEVSAIKNIYYYNTRKRK